MAFWKVSLSWDVSHLWLLTFQKCSGPHLVLLFSDSMSFTNLSETPRADQCCPTPESSSVWKLALPSMFPLGLLETIRPHQPSPALAPQDAGMGTRCYVTVSLHLIMLSFLFTQPASWIETLPSLLLLLRQWCLELEEQDVFSSGPRSEAGRVEEE